MKKFIICVLALIGMTMSANAQSLTVDDVYAVPGKTVKATLKLTCDANTYAGLMFSIQFPKEIASKVSVKGLEGLAQPTVGKMDETGKVKFSGINGLDSDNNIIYLSASTELKVSILVSSDLDYDKYDVKVTDFKLDKGGDLFDVDDVTFKLNVVDYIYFDEASSTLPDFDDGASAKVMVKRTIKAGEWSTIILPFSLTMKNAQTVFGTDVQLAQLENIETTFASEEDLTPVAIKVNFKTYTLSALNKLKAGTPYLIKVSNDIVEPFTVEGVTLTKELSETSVKDAVYEDALTGKMKGSFTTGTIPANSLFISENKFWYSTGETNVKAFRCWFVLDPIIGKNFAESRISFAIDDEPTMVEGFATEPILDGEYYDLKGQRVETPSKGIYIKNGKKVVVK